MNPKEAQGILDDWLEEIIAAMPPYQRVLPQSARQAIITEALLKRYERAVAEDSRDKEALIMHMVHNIVMEYLAELEPSGQYDPESMLCLDGKLYMPMAKATKEHVQQWRDHMAKKPEQGCNYGNILYADARLAIWEKEKTLAELETHSSH